MQHQLLKSSPRTSLCLSLSLSVSSFLSLFFGLSLSASTCTPPEDRKDPRFPLPALLPAPPFLKPFWAFGPVQSSRSGSGSLESSGSGSAAPRRRARAWASSRRPLPKDARMES